MERLLQFFISCVVVVREMSMSTDTIVSCSRVETMKSTGYRRPVTQKRHAICVILL
jgi:hypothetical protein